MTERLTLDLNGALEGQSGRGGLRPEELLGLEERASAAVRSLLAQRQTLPFMDLPFHTAAAESAQSLGRELADEFENVVVLGIGGSALGPKALFTGLSHPLHNLRSASERRGARL